MVDGISRYLFAGQLTRDFILLPGGQTLLDVPGGNVLYAAVGASIWEPDPPPAIVARVGEDYPKTWLDLIDRKAIDVRGVRVLPQPVDVRSFAAFTSRTARSNDDPVAHFARAQQTFPKELLGYKPSAALDSRTRLTTVSLRQGDLIPDYLDATAAHLCPVDYLTHSLLPAVLRQASFTTVTLDPSPGYMNPVFWSDIPSLLTGLTAFFPAEEDVRALFHGRSNDLWEMADALAFYNCELIIIKRGEGGQVLLDAASRKRWEIPSYPINLVNPIGAGDAFCGGFLAGYRRTFDPLEAVLHGNISASLVIEGHDPFYALDALPGLAQARLEALRENVHRL
jgi:sugar/nucleoside kinase (ribokinase family)